eukprot:14254948-Alexandrium_andersonii.AAC.1
MKRWFSWMTAAQWHDRWWHTELLVLLHLAWSVGQCTTPGEMPWTRAPPAQPPPEPAEAPEPSAASSSKDNAAQPKAANK